MQRKQERMAAAYVVTLTILPLLNELPRGVGRVVHIKVKSHTGCLLNERAYDCAEHGYTSEYDTLCPGPDKYG
jgi:hypothetical protein